MRGLALGLALAALSLSFAIMPFVAQCPATIGWRRTYALGGSLYERLDFCQYAARSLFGGVWAKARNSTLYPIRFAVTSSIWCFAEIYVDLFAVFTQGGGRGSMLMGKAFDRLSLNGLILSRFRGGETGSLCFDDQRSGP